MMETIWQDVRYSVRLLARQRGFALVAILTLALGIGASTAIFSVIDAAMLRPLPYPQPEQLVRINIEITGSDGRTDRYGPSYNDLLRWQQAGAFSAIATWRNVIFGRIVDGEQPERITAGEMSLDYLKVFATAPILGRGFTTDDMVPGAPPVILLGYRYWQSHFGGDQHVVGRSLKFDDGPATIIGVLPARFEASTPIWRPVQIPDPDMRATGRDTNARLLPGISADEAGQRLTAMTPPRRGPRWPAVETGRARQLDARRDTGGISDDRQHPFWRGRPDSADCVRQRRRPAARARRDAPGGVRGPRVDRRGTRTPDPSAAHRERRPVSRRRRGRSARRLVDARRARREYSPRVLRRRAGRTQSPRHGRHDRSDRPDRTDLRACARLPIVARAVQHRARPRQPSSRLRAHHARRPDAHRRGSRAGRGARRGCGLDDPQLRAHRGCGPGVRPGRFLHDEGHAAQPGPVHTQPVLPGAPPDAPARSGHLGRWRHRQRPARRERHLHDFRRQRQVESVEGRSRSCPATSRPSDNRCFKARCRPTPTTRADGI